MGAWWAGVMTSLGGWLVNPWIFVAGAAAVSVPIIIHLLNRRKFIIVDWAAMDFLLEADKKNRRRVRLENWLLLLLRCLAIFIIGMLLARPFDSSGITAGLFDAQKFERILVVDDSLSTQARVNNRSVMEITKERLVDLARLFAAEKSDNSLTLILTSDPTNRKFNGSHVSPKNVDEIASELENLEATDSPAQLERALLEVDQYLTGQPKNVNRVVYVLSDMRRRDWQPQEPEAATEGADKGKPKATEDANSTASQPVELLRRISKEAKGCFVVNVGDKEDRNLVIREVKPEKTLVTGVESRFDISVANTGTQEVSDVRVKFTAGDAVPITQTIEKIAPGEVESVRIPFTFVSDETEDPENLVSRKVKIEVLPERGAESDRLAADSTVYFAARVVPGIPVLLVDGDPSANYGNSETFYLRRALTPPGRILSGVSATVVTDTELDSVDLSKYQVIFLCNLFRLSDKALEDLQKWVTTGGGLVLFPGSQVDEEFFNTRLYGKGETAGKELSPVKLETVMGDENEEAWSGFKVEDEQHPILKDFVGQQNPLLSQVKVFRWWKAAPSKLTTPFPANVLIRLTDADDSPMFVERQYGKGKVVVSTIPCDADWSDWPSDPSYILTMQELVRYLSPGDAAAGVVRVGEPLNWEIDLTRQNFNADLVMPGDRKIGLQAAVIPGNEESRWLYEFKGAAKQGFYELQLANRDGSGENILFAANVDPNEGDLRVANLEAIQRELRDTNIQFVSGANASLTGVGAQMEIWKYLLWLLIGLLLAEQVLGWFFGLRR